MYWRRVRRGRGQRDSATDETYLTACFGVVTVKVFQDVESEEQLTQD
ncbi:MAG: hypothetical protein ACFCVA_09230 [Gammaproteobacteria bacterium]